MEPLHFSVRLFSLVDVVTIFSPRRYNGCCFDFSAAELASLDPAKSEFLAAYLTNALLWSSETVWSTAFRVSKESHSGLASQPLRKIRKGKLQKTIARLRKYGIKVRSCLAWFSPLIRQPIRRNIVPIGLQWRGAPIEPELFCTFPAKARGLNGCCLLGPGVLLVADSFASLIWRVDFNLDSGEPSVRVWKSHDSMGYFPGKMKPEQPGVNGVRYAMETNYAYYTATAKKLFMRVAVNPYTLEAEGEPELVVAGRMGDDFCIDASASVIYLATHRQNTIDVISMEPGLNSGFTQCVAGDPFTEKLIGPSGGAWGRIPGQLGRTAFFLTDGGTASPPPTGPQTAKLLRVEFQPITGAFPGSG